MHELPRHSSFLHDVGARSRYILNTAARPHELLQRSQDSVVKRGDVMGQAKHRSDVSFRPIGDTSTHWILFRLLATCTS